MRFSSLVYPIMALSVAAVAGCSSDSTDTGNTTACTVTLTGAVSATGTCSTVAAAYATASATSAIAFSISSPAVSVAISLPGTLGTNTYTNATSGAAGGITVTSGSSVYYAVVANGTPTGSFSLHLTSVSTLASVAAGTSYTVHGTLTGTLVPASGTGTNVTFSSSF
jgi:hypothetical protein